MVSKAEIKRLMSYKQSKYRNAENLFAVEGIKMTQELLESDFEPIAIYATESWIEENGSSFEQNKTKKHFTQTKINVISNEELTKISSLSTANNVYCLVRKPQLQVLHLENQLTIVLDKIKDPGNLGTILRIADWFGIKNVVCSSDTVDLFNPKTVQATMGSIFRVNVRYTNLETFLRSIPPSFPVYGTLAQNGKDIYQTQLSHEGIIVIGSESFGISENIKPLINCNLTIPRFSNNTKPESLNASIAAAIIISEFKRRK
jgi:TrmH family RNA methyltransferase